jgi:hypothetical protein
MRAWFLSARPASGRRFSAALAALALAGAGAGIALSAGSALATGSPDGSPVGSPPASSAPAVTCTATPDIVYGWDGGNEFAARLADGDAPCYDVTVNLTSYNVPATWDGLGWDASASPQTEFATDTLTFPAYSTAEVTATVPAPSCGNYQVDAYPGDVQTAITYPSGTVNFLVGGIVPQPACAIPDVGAGPTFTDATCSSSTTGYTIAAVTGVEFFVKVDTGSPVAATAGSFVPVTVGHSVVITAVAEPGYPALSGYPAGGWTHTFATPSDDCATPTPTPTPTPTTPTIVITPVSAVPTGSVTESCQTGGGNESYTVTLVNPAASTNAPVQFRVSVNGGVAATSGTIASGASFTNPGALPNGSSATFTAEYRPVGTTAWTPVVLTGSTPVFPCPSVQGETFVKPTTVTPTTVQPVVVVTPVLTKPSKPTATLPFTGLPTIPTALVAFALVAIGGLFVFIGRRRRGWVLR